MQEILEGKHDDKPEVAFYMVGGISDVAAKAEELAAEEEARLRKQASA